MEAIQEIIPIIIRNLEELEQLIQESTTVESFTNIQSLEIGKFELSESSIENDDFDETLLSFLAQCTSLSQLCIKSVSVAQLVLSRTFCETSLEGLESLIMDSVFDDMVEGLEDQFFYIELLPCLTSLTLIINDTQVSNGNGKIESEEEELEEEQEEEQELFDTIPLLSITANLSNPSVPKLLARFSHISLLALTDNSSSPPPLATLLSQIHPSVRGIFLSATNSNIASEEKIDDVIGRFDLLDSLTIDCNVFTSAVYSNLPSSLVEINFGPHSKPIDIGVLLDNPPIALRHVRLDVTELDGKILSVEEKQQLVKRGKLNLLTVDGTLVDEIVNLEGTFGGITLN